MLVKFKNRAKADALPASPKNGRGVLSPPNDRALAALFEKHSVTQARQPFSRGKSDSLRRVVKLTSHGLKGNPKGTKELVEELRRDPGVEYAEPNYLMRTQRAPNDPYFASSGAWGQGFRDLWGLEKIAAEAAWELTRGDGVVVAVTDTGVDYGHEDLAANIWQNAGETGADALGRDKRANGVDDDGNGFVDDWRGWDFVTVDGTPGDNDPMDDEGHGTHVAGTVAAVGDNGVGIAGVAPRSKVMALKGLDSNGGGSLEDLAAAIVYASDNGARVINASWGAFIMEPVQTMEVAVAYARQKDVLFVAAAGNSMDVVGTPAYGYTPANLRDAVAVSAFTHDDTLAAFSNYGQKIDLAAPGGGDDDPSGAVNDPWRSILSLASSQASGYARAGHLFVGTRYLRLAGTSMAAPHVAGAAALVRSLHPEFSAEQVRQALRAGGDDTGAPGPDEQSGYGRLNAARALALSSPLAVKLTTPAETLTGVEQVEIRGTVAGAGLAGWRLEYRPAADAAAAWTLLHSSSVPVSDSTLATWDITAVADGKYDLRVVATNTDGQAFEDRLPVLIDNIFITDPTPDWPRIYRGDSALAIRGTVTPANLSGYTFSVGRTIGFALENPNITLAGGGTQRVRDGLLATWDTTGVPAGSYRITLNVNLTNGTTLRKSVTVIIEPSIHEGSPKALPNISHGIFSYIFADHLAAADIDGDGGHDLVVGYGDSVGVYDHAGRMLPGWPQTIDPDRAGELEQKSPAIGDLDGDGSPEIAAKGGPYAFVWRSDGTPLPGWPKVIGESRPSYFSIVDLDNDGDNELVMMGETLHVVDKDGALLPGWPVDLRYGGTRFLNFVICDLDADGQKEVVARANSNDTTELYVFGAGGSLKPGWPQRVDGLAVYGISAHPAAGDLDGDGDYEIVLAAADGRVHAYQHNGTVAAGWPQQTTGVEANSPAVGDLDGDGRAEVVAGNGPAAVGWERSNYLFAWRGDGSLLPGWPVKRDGPFDYVSYGFTAPVLADVDGDGAVDIVASGDRAIQHEVLFAYRLDGSQAAGFPKHATAPGAFHTTSPAVADLDGDGQLELAWVDADKLLYVWDLPSARSAPAPWPMYRHDAALTGASYAPGYAQRQWFQLSSVAYTAGEGAGGLQFTVRRVGGSAGAVSVSYATSEGMAFAGADYTTASGTVTFADGDATAKTFTVPIANDALDEYDEMFYVNLSAPTGGVRLGHQSRAAMMIVDDDASPSVSVGDVSVAEGSGGATSVTFNVTLSAQSGRAVVVNYATADGTAVRGGDYTAASGMVIFDVGQTVKTITVPVNGDTVNEPDETFFLNLTSSTHAAVADGQGRATLTNDDQGSASSIVNHALASNGAAATASTFLNSNRAPLAAINGDRRGIHWDSDPATGSGWTDATQNAFPDWLEVSFPGPKSVSEVHVFSVQDAYLSPSEPTEAMTFTRYGVTGFQVEYWNGSAWLLVPNGVIASSNKVWAKVVFPSLTTAKVRVVVNKGLTGSSRLNEVEVWGAPDASPPPLVNHALAANGATASATSTYAAGRAPLAAINGDRKGLHWGSDPSTGSGWTDVTKDAFPDRLEVQFAGERTITEVSVIGLQDNFSAPADPAEAMTSASYALTSFAVEYWTGSAWAQVPGGVVTGNNKVWRRLSFPAVTTTRLRLTVNAALGSYSRVAEFEAWGPAPASAPRLNVAASANGATATATSTLDSTRLPLAAINGDRRGLHWGSDPSTGSGWTDKTSGAFPDRLEVAFNGAKTITEVSVFGLQDGFQSPAEPTEVMTSSNYALQDFDVEYWTGSAWAVVPGGQVVGNSKVWRKVTFPALTTARIRVSVKRALGSYSRIAEVEAY